MTTALDNFAPQLDRFRMQKRYEELCGIRDMVLQETAEERKRAEEAANVAEAHRVKSIELSKALYDKRGGEKWFQLKKEIGILAKCLSGTLPPTASDQAKAHEVMGRVK